MARRTVAGTSPGTPDNPPDNPPVPRAQRARLSRAAILDSARREFARHGYARATVRAIAAGADIDPSMVMRYFGDKRALFEAATDGHLPLPDLTAVPVRRRGRVLAEHFIEFWNGPAAEDRFRMLLLSASSDDESAGRMRTIVSEQLLPMVRDVTGPDGAGTRTALIASALPGVALLRLVIAAPELASVPDNELAAQLGRTIDRYLTMPLPAGSR